MLKRDNFPRSHTYRLSRCWRVAGSLLGVYSAMHAGAVLVRVKVFGGLLGAWRICARERSGRAGGGCGRGKAPSHGRDFLKICIDDLDMRF